MQQPPSPSAAVCSPPEVVATPFECIAHLEYVVVAVAAVAGCWAIVAEAVIGAAAAVDDVAAVVVVDGEPVHQLPAKPSVTVSLENIECHILNEPNNYF